MEENTMPELRDVVYILREDIDPYELRYSLRSVAQNFPHRHVWFVCGQPEGFTPDGRIAHKQTGVNKWDNVRSSLFKVLTCEDISDDFYLFNDDFFVMKPVSGDFINYTAGTLEHRIRELVMNCGSSNYCKQLEKTRNELLIDGFDAISFCVHLPLLINKAKALEVLNSALGSPMFRSQYGNRAQVPYTYHADVKVYDLGETPAEDVDYLSTTELTFRDGKVGEFIRARFPNPSRFEV